VGKNSSPVGVVGHSFGGRVALEYLDLLLDENARREVCAPKSAWILDSVPGHAHSGVRNVIRAVSSVPQPIPSKKELVQNLTDLGIESSIALWMTTNLVQLPEKGFEFCFDLNVANAMLDDFPKQNYVEILRSLCQKENHECQVNLVRAGRNSSWTSSVLKQLEPLLQHKSYRMHVLPNAGHWVHVDDLDGLLALMDGSFAPSNS